ncbi:hypothetical protein DE146DRAFT_633689 [Phaeosphaeria sp. MPI-PUGE-AT-0046c]|nr:hypothetical protein DE146DRAFT_633689 [Phaeosphaeria sp. MPI-PUGE-AT-0046c]
MSKYPYVHPLLRRPHGEFKFGLHDRTTPPYQLSSWIARFAASASGLAVPYHYMPIFSSISSTFFTSSSYLSTTILTSLMNWEVMRARSSVRSEDGVGDAGAGNDGGGTDEMMGLASWAGSKGGSANIFAVFSGGENYGAGTAVEEEILLFLRAGYSLSSQACFRSDACVSASSVWDIMPSCLAASFCLILVPQDAESASLSIPASLPPST